MGRPAPALVSRFFIGWVCSIAQLAGVDTPTPVAAIASLSDPARLATLSGERAANERLHEILAWLEEGRRAGVVASKTLDEALKLTGDIGPHGQAVKEMLLRDFEIAQRAALFTPENLALMKSGRSPRVPSGSYKDQPYEVDHVIPVAEFPQLGTELANLIYLPRTVNRRKSAEVQQRALDLGQKLLAAGILTPDQYQRLRQLKNW